MGMIRCEKHGLTGICINIDKTVVDAILKEKPLNENKIYMTEITMEFREEDEFYSHTFTYYIHASNYKDFNLKQSYIANLDDDEDAIEKIEKTFPPLGIACGKCFNEFLEQNNIEVIKSNAK